MIKGVIIHKEIVKRIIGNCNWSKSNIDFNHIYACIIKGSSLEKVKNIEAIYVKEKISRINIPIGRYVYDIRSTIKNHYTTIEPIVVHGFHGSIITDVPIEFIHEDDVYYMIKKFSKYHYHNSIHDTSKP